MKKYLIISITALGLTIFWAVWHSTNNELNRQQQGWLKQFTILNYRLDKQTQKINSIDAHIQDQYLPFIQKSLKIDNFGIGGYSNTNWAKFSKFHSTLQHTSRKMKITLSIAKVINQKLITTAKLARHYKDSIDHTPTIRPVPLDSVQTISSYGLRMHPFLHVLKMHEGIDYGCEVGTPVYATADGIVTVSSYDPITGQFIKIEHGYGYTTLYGHLSKRLVVEGEKVKKGQLIGYTGNSGRSVGPHLHYEVRIYGQHVNPVLFIPNPIYAEAQSLHSKRSKSFLIAR